MPIYKEKSGNVTRVLEPTNGSAIINVVSDYTWTLSPKTARDDVPFATLVEYQQTTAQLLATLTYYYKQIRGGMSTISNDFSRLQSSVQQNGLGDTIIASGFNNNFLQSDYKLPYASRYIADKTGFTYTLPYFSDLKYSRKNKFGDFSMKSDFSGATSIAPDILVGGKIGKGIIGGTMKSVSAISNFFQGVLNLASPGKVGLMDAQTWSSIETEAYTINFPLLNTNSFEDVEKNRELLYLLAYQNSPSRRNFFMTDPCVIYEVYIPDIVHMPAAYISDFTVKNLGNTSMINGKPVPEVYDVSITVQSLFPPSRNIMVGVDNPANKVSAITETKEVLNAINQMLTPTDPNSGLPNQFNLPLSGTTPRTPTPQIANPNPNPQIPSLNATSPRSGNLPNTFNLPI